jgi:hypothetical protein
MGLDQGPSKMQDFKVVVGHIVHNELFGRE